MIVINADQINLFQIGVIGAECVMTIYARVANGKMIRGIVFASIVKSSLRRPTMSRDDENKQCLNCKHWMGDKSGGLLGEGTCRLRYEWCNIDIDGDADVTVTIDANHCCRLWEADRD